MKKIKELIREFYDIRFVEERFIAAMAVISVLQWLVEGLDKAKLVSDRLDQLLLEIEDELVEGLQEALRTGRGDLPV